MDLSALIKKIGHSLVEIRVRALKSIICKLDHSLISVSDIVQEKMLFVYLLEWFNFPEVPMQEEVLELLTTLSKHPSAAQMLRDVGAVDFLTQLSPNVEPRLQAVISGTLDQLFQLPELLPCKTIVYSRGPLDTAPTVHESVKCLKFSVFPWLTLTNTDRHILSSNESSLRSNNPHLVRTTCDLLCDVIMQDFPPEIFLQRPNIVKSLLSLLRVGSGKGEASYLHMQALSCLRQLCTGLRRKLRFYQDPGFYSTKQDPVSQNSSFSYSQEVRGTQRSQDSSPREESREECSPRPSVVGRTGQRARGDGQDGDAASNRSQAPRQTPQSPTDVAHLDLPELGVEDDLELQLQQLTVAQFTVATMEHAVPLLKTGRKGSHVFHCVLELLCNAVLLLGDSVCELVWDDRSLVGMELKEKLQAFMGLLGDILSYHQSYAADIPASSQVHHRIAYTGTAIFTIKLLQTILPPEKASDNLPESIATAIFHLCLDTSLGTLLPSVKEAAVAYLEQVNPDSHDLYRQVNRAALWMESTCNFIKEGEKNWLELLELADQAIHGLPFHHHLPIINEFTFCTVFKYPLLQTESQKLLLKLLSHPLLPVKTETYTCTLNLVKDCLGIQNVSRQNPGACGGVNFLLHYRVLYEISTFGLQDSAEKVNVAAKDILLYLLKGRLMMTASTWDRFNEALYPVMPILQVLCSFDSDEILHICMSETEHEDTERKCVRFYVFSLQLNTKCVCCCSPQSMDCLLEPCICILRKLVYADPSLRHNLAQHNLLLLTLLRVHVAARSYFILFCHIRSDKSSADVTLTPFSLPLTVIRRYNIPFQAASHHAVSPYCCILPSSSGLLTLAPARQALQVAWNIAWHSGIDNLLEEFFHPNLKLSEAQILSLKAMHLHAALRDCIQAIVTAAGHNSVTSALSKLSLYLLIDRLATPHIPIHRCRETLQSLSWHTAMTRFLQVRPACVEDERLLVGIVAFLNAYFRQTHTESASDPEDKDLCWILELLVNQTSSQGPGESEELKNHVNQRLQRELTGFFKTLLLCLAHTTDRLCLALAGPFKSQLAVCLLRSLRVSDAPRFYGLPSLERTLQGMVSLTAQPGWSSYCPDLEPISLCSKYLSGLLEVISSFYVEWGGNSMSFMGKGVTKNAVICLLHLSYEMLAENKEKDFISQWSLGNEAATEETTATHLGLAWLIPLWVDRDQEVRFASLGLGGALSSVPSGCQALCASCQNISGGLWGTLLNILLDQQESSMVRREAAFILQNLLVMPMPANAEEAKDSHWQHPCVHDEVSGISLVGLPALQALLYHCQYFQHVALSASICYRGRYTFHRQPCVGASSDAISQDSDSLCKLDSCISSRALMTLLSCSPTAQKHAAKAGLIDSCVEQMKQTHSQLLLESVRPGKVSHRKKDEGYLKEVKLSVEILRSALYCNDECKVSLCVLALYALWPWLLLDDTTMEAVLELLCVYTANCTTACSSLCTSGPGVPPGMKGTSSSSLMHAVMKLASGVAPDNSPVQRLAFYLLANLAISRDCRGLLQKNNFLQAFPSVPMPKAGGAKAASLGGGGTLLGLWLRLLVSLSSAEDIQLSILRVTGALELLADLAPHRRHALLTLHNLCFCPANKPPIIANDKAMKVLLSCLESKELETRCIGASALWALLHNNQRVRKDKHTLTQMYMHP
uniref:Rotatin n=1 Tax=Echeneis naucrates TaxID=173247 RepID=A0A665VME3_ECHNA